ncbi:MAG: AAA family ATPase [Cyanobacteriota bacterium]|nr:AAA family ATPase [Cyanobacteriota bacterium]
MTPSSALPELIQQMLQPGFYPHSVTLPIELIQTHISYIFLTGDFAYKVKKPLDFGFLDFTTLEKRHHFCLEELRMNQRGAPDLYLEVLPISQADGDPYQLAGHGEAVEYVLKMRQFPQEALFSRLFEQGELTIGHMEALGRVVAEFHAQTLTNPRIREFGRVEQVREAFDQNYEQTEAYIGGPQTLQQFEETRAYTDHFFANNVSLFEQRMAQDRIRECHGDLHLRNICLWENKILLFDCIEFNESFRFVDVMYDIAYGVMDLDALGRPDLGNAYLNTYLEMTGDWEGLQVLPIYLNRQSYVRAKVISFLLGDPSAPESVKAEASKTAASYYHLAWSYTQPQQGGIWVMAGLSGSGKSTVARHLARQQQAIHIRSDAVRKHLAGIPLYGSGGAEVYSPQMTQQTYQRLEDLGCLLACQGYRVILDAKYDQQGVRESLLNRADQQGIPIAMIHCFAPPAVLQERLRKRADARSPVDSPTPQWEIGTTAFSPDIADATVDLIDQQLAQWQPFSTQELERMIALDTDGDWQAQISQTNWRGKKPTE